MSEYVDILARTGHKAHIAEYGPTVTLVTLCGKWLQGALILGKAHSMPLCQRCRQAREAIAEANGEPCRS